MGNFLVRSVFQTSDQPGTFKCARARCKTCPFIRNVEKISGPKRSIKLTDHFTCTSANVIYCITCTLCKKLYIGETGRRLGDRFREHLRDLEKDDQNASKPVNASKFGRNGQTNVFFFFRVNRASRCCYCCKFPRDHRRTEAYQLFREKAVSLCSS